MSQPVGKQRVLRTNGFDDVVVIGRQQTVRGGVPDEVEMHVQHAAALVEQPFLGADEVGVPPGRRNRHVEVTFGRRHGEVVECF
ncbi:hypothetical protein ACXYMW_12755 [Roseivivax sp. CAU 1761]